LKDLRKVVPNILPATWNVDFVMVDEREKNKM
jgi:hypothetical protein